MSKDDGGLCLHDMEAFNEALLTMQFWRLLKDHNSLVVCIFRAKYYLEGNMFNFNAMLGSRASFTWCNIMGVKDVIIRGSR